MNELGKFLRRRSREIGLSMSDVARRAKKSRQTLHHLTLPSARLPHLKTIVDIARVVNVHPAVLVAVLFESDPTLVKRMRGASQLCRCGVNGRAAEGAHAMREVEAGSKFVHAWRIPNVGSWAWSGVFARCVDGEAAAGQSGPALMPSVPKIDLPDTAVGGMADIKVEFTAPSEPGVYASRWMLDSPLAEGAGVPGAGLACEVRVVEVSDLHV